MPLPALVIPVGLEPWQLGKPENSDKLKEILAPFEFGKFWVTDLASERHLTDIREQFDRSADAFGLNIFHRLIHAGDQEERFRSLLALGLDFEKLSCGYTYRISHDCSFFGRINCAKALSCCRPDLNAKRDGKESLQEIALVSARTFHLLNDFVLLHDLTAQCC